jgi:hypothetical protein
MLVITDVGAERWSSYDRGMVALRVSAALMSLVALGFGSPLPWVADHLLRERTLPTFFDMFPMYGGPLFARCSHSVFVVTLGAFMAVCAAELFAAYLLWCGHRLGAQITLALLPVEIAAWVAFALPIPPVVCVARIILLLVGWSALR